MKSFWKLLWILLLLVSFSPVTAEVFDLGDVLIMDKGDEINQITSTNTISIEDIKMQGAKSVAEALELVPGIDIQPGKKGQATLKLRGFDQSTVRVLIDGVPAHESYNGSLDLDQIPIDTIAKIKVIKGASSVLYGPNTMGGVINIITKKGGEKPYTSITTSFGENNTRNYVFNHGATKGKFNYWITGSQRKTDGFDVSGRFDPNNPRTGLGTDFNEDGGTRDLSYFTKNTFNSKLGYEYDNNSKLYVSFDYHDNEKGCPTEDSRYWEFDEWNQWQLSLVGEHDFSSILSVKARIYYVDHEDTLEDVSWDADHNTAKKWFVFSTWDDYTIGSEVHAYLDFGDASLVKMGVNYMKDNHRQQEYWDDNTYWVTNKGKTAGLQPEEEYETDIYSFGIEDEVRLFDKLTLNAGVSYDIHDPVKAYGGLERDSIETWNPQAGLSFDLTRDLNVYASIGKKTRFPQMQELYSTLSGGDKSLKPQQTIAYEIGVKKKFGRVLDISVAAFLNDIEDRIVNEKISGVKTFLNKGEARFQGVETQADITTPWDLKIRIGYTYLSAREKEGAASPEKDAENIPKHKASLDIRYVFDFGLSTSFQAIYTGEQIEYDDSKNEVTLDSFVVCNARLSQEISVFNNIKTDLFLEAKNIFDENYEEGSGPTPGRSLLFGMTVSF